MTIRENPKLVVCVIIAAVCFCVLLTVLFGGVGSGGFSNGTARQPNQFVEDDRLIGEPADTLFAVAQSNSMNWQILEECLMDEGINSLAINAGLAVKIFIATDDVGEATKIMNRLIKQKQIDAKTIEIVAKRHNRSEQY